MRAVSTMYEVIMFTPLCGIKGGKIMYLLLILPFSVGNYNFSKFNVLVLAPILNLIFG